MKQKPQRFTNEFKRVNKVEEKSGDDFYYDEVGRVVFTSHFHLKRGYCCESGCRHCPYKGKKEDKSV